LKAFSWKLFGVLLVLLVAVLFTLPSVVMYSQGTSEPELWPHKKINLGLDLQGGMHLVLEVQVDKAVEIAIEAKIDDIRRILAKKQITNKGFVKRDDSAILDVRIEGIENTEKFRQILKKDFQELEITSETSVDVITTFALNFITDEADRIRKFASDQALETIRNRIDEFGVSEPDIRRQGENRILIQLPGIKDTKSAKDLIGKTATLTFRLVDEEHDLQTALATNAPPGSEILYEIKRDATTGAESKIPHLIKKRVRVSGEALTDARVLFDSMENEPYVAIEFDKKGAKRFGRVTGENINKRLAIILDGKVYSAPVIQGKITGGSARITGSFDMASARVLAIALRAGALPAPVEFIEERTVGPTLGKDSINKGIMSMLIGGLIVVIFMIIYYGLSGLIADIALALNILLMVAGLAICQATLTLPGIAGFILTIGMAVDANVLIFERIREELKLGQTALAAVSAGFEKASLTIVDANVTTLIVAIVLFQFGSGPVKGFAVTLGLGILASLFTSLVISRMFFDLMLKMNIKKLSI